MQGRGAESIAGFANSAFFAADVGQRIVNESSRNSGFTLAVGGTGGFELLGAGDGALGSYLAVDWSNGFDLNVGPYWSSEIGGKPGILKREGHFGLESTLFTSPEYQNALGGYYSIKGIDGTIGNKSIDFGKVSAAEGTINGYQASWTISNTHSHSQLEIYSKRGYGQPDFPWF